jgi:uncharacterized protein (DUF1015 family)
MKLTQRYKKIINHKIFNWEQNYGHHMVEIAPFRGFRYNKNVVKDDLSIIAPPYDVIDPDMQQKLHNRSKYNISMLTKGKKLPNDDDTNNIYTRASELLNRWIADNVLIQDEKPSIYVLSQEFSIGTGAEQRPMTRSGFIAALKLEEFCTGGSPGEGCVGIHQHEETLAKDIEDRLCLCRTTLSNFGQIFGIYPDHERKTETILSKVMSQEPVMVAKDDEGVTHKLWLMQDDGLIQELKQLLANKSVIIADGHHRYKTALKLHEEHIAPDDPVSESSEFRMMTLVNMMNEGLVILPTHRLIQKVENFEPTKLLKDLEQNFNIKQFPIKGIDDSTACYAMLSELKSAFDTDEHAFGLYCKTGQYYLLTLKDISAMDNIVGRSKAWRNLDVSILHQLILQDLLGIDKTKLASGTITGGAYVEYIKDIGDAVSKAIYKVDNDGYQALFFMNPTPVEEVEEVSTNHETMPQKSTFFYPKIYTGYVIYKL